MKSPLHFAHFKPSLLLPVLLITHLIAAQSASGAILLQIEGTVTFGSLNGVGISNSEFVFTADIFDLTDQMPLSPEDATYHLENAEFNFGTDRLFVDTASSLEIFLTDAEPGNDFVAYLDLRDTFLDGSNGIQMWDYSTAISGFDAEPLTDFGPHSDFVDEVFGRLDLTNAFGDRVIIEGFAPSSLTMSITAVPEPSSFMACIGIASIFGTIRSRRRKRRTMSVGAEKGPRMPA